MKKNTKKFISSVVALGMAFSSVSATSIVFADDAVAVETDSTASGSAVEVDDASFVEIKGDVVEEADDDAVVMGEPSLKTSADVKFGDTQQIGDVTVTYMQDCLTKDATGLSYDGTNYVTGLVSNSANNTTFEGGKGRCIIMLKATKDTKATVVTKSYAADKAAGYMESDSDLGVGGVTTDTPVALTTTVAKTSADYAADATVYTLDVDMKAGKYYYVAGRATNLILLDVIVSDSTAGGGEEEAAAVGTATVSPEVDKYTVTTSDNTTTVKLVLTADDAKSAFSSVTGMFKWNPEFATLTKAKALATNADNQVFEDSDFSNYLNVTVSENLEGYDAADIGKTEAEVGKLKLGQFFKTGDDLVDLTKVEYSLTFTVKATSGSDTVTYEPMNVKNSADGKITVTSNPATIEVGEAAKTGTYAIEVTDVTPDASGKIVLNNDKDTFTVAVKAANDFDVNALTAALTYDPTVVQAVSATAAGNTTLLPVDVVNTAIKYVPSASNTEFAGADGTKTAAELGKIKLANVVTEGDKLVDAALTKDQTILVVTFKAVGKGDAAITFNNIQSTNAALDEVVTTGSEATVNVTSEVENAKTYHLLGDMDHNGVLDSTDATLALDIANKEVDELSVVIGNVQAPAEGVLDATDASVILSAANGGGTYDFTERTGDDIIEIEVDGKTQRYVAVTIPEGTDATSWKGLVTK